MYPLGAILFKPPETGISKALTSLLPRSCTSQTQAGVAQAGGFLTETQTCAGLFCNEPSLCVTSGAVATPPAPAYGRAPEREGGLPLLSPCTLLCVHMRSYTPLTEEMIHSQVQRLGSEQPAWVKGTKERKLGGMRWGPEAGCVLQNHLPHLEALMGVTPFQGTIGVQSPMGRAVS